MDATYAFAGTNLWPSVNVASYMFVEFARNAPTGSMRKDVGDAWSKTTTSHRLKLPEISFCADLPLLNRSSHIKLTSALSVNGLHMAASTRPFDTDLLLRMMDAWKKATMDGIDAYLTTHWKPAHRCHICHWVGQSRYHHVCPSCKAWNVLSLITVPLHRCHLCGWVGNPDLPQCCPKCERFNTLSLYMAKKLYDNQIMYRNG